MGKTTNKKKPTRRSVTPAELQRKLRKLDRDLIRQLNEHGRLRCQLAKLQKADDQRLYDIDDEHQLMDELVATSRGPLDEQCIRNVLGELYSGTRALLAPIRVAYLGPEYSYSHQAAIQRFGGSAELVPVSNIADVFEEVNRHQADFGIVPIENSTDGRIVDTLDMFARLPAKICGEVQLKIHHHLLGKCERREIQEVYSKPQALSQCRQWLARHLPAARTVEITSTAAAAKLAADKQAAAAVASQQAAVQYGLSIIASDIEDNKHNVTRFAVIGNQPAGRTGRDKTSIMFEIPHEPGALAEATAIFKRNRLNMTWIESFPIPGTPSEYLFFVEVEGHQNEMKIKRTLQALSKKTVRLDILGSYAITEPVG